MCSLDNRINVQIGLCSMDERCYAGVTGTNRQTKFRDKEKVFFNVTSFKE